MNNALRTLAAAFTVCLKSPHISTDSLSRLRTGTIGAAYSAYCTGCKVPNDIVLVVYFGLQSKSYWPCSTKSCMVLLRDPLDQSLLLLPSPLVMHWHIQYGIGINVKGYINLGEFLGAGGIPISWSCPGHLCLALTDNCIHRCLLSIIYIENTCLFLVGWWFQVISLVNMPHRVSMPRERGVIFKRTICVTWPANLRFCLHDCSYIICQHPRPG